MKSLSSEELVQYWAWIFSHTEGAQLQDIWTNDRLIVMEFYKFKNFWLLFDLNMTSPQVVLLQNEANFGVKKTKPLGLFLSSHAKNRRLVEGEVAKNKGRVLVLRLAGSAENICEVEAQLIPRSVNVIVRVNGKSISWLKPRELPENHSVPPTEEKHSMDWSSRENEWLDFYFGTRSEQKSERSVPSKALEKKKKAMVALQAQLDSEEHLKWRELGEALKISSVVPKELKEYYNSKEDKSWNMGHAFAKSKALQAKKEGTLKRLRILEDEIIELLHPMAGEAASPKKVYLKQKEQKFDSRKIQFEENLFALIGKSAKDNLEILRQAQPWCLWLHLKDYPSAHAIIFCQKGWQPKPEILQRVAEKLLATSLGKKNKDLGAKYEVVVVECRYVRPIKGDKLGRVNYHHPKVFTFASKS